MTPAWCLIHAGASLEQIQHVHKLYPNAVYGDFLVHTTIAQICTNSLPLSVLEYFVSQHPDTLFQHNSNWDRPMQTALYYINKQNRTKESIEAFEFLLR